MADMTVNFPALEDMVWEMRDETQYGFLEQKYRNRKKLSDEAEATRKHAEKNETIDGKPNPAYPRLRLEADMAQLRFEMAYVIERNARLAQYIETLEYLHQKVGILEGAYGHTKLLVETCRIDYALVSKAAGILGKHKQEQVDGKEKAHSPTR